MIKFIIRRVDDSVYCNNIEISLKKLNLNHFCDVKVTNEDINFGFANSYNKGIEAYNKHGIDEDDIYGFIHEDCLILDPNFVQKLEMTFKMKPEVGLVSVTGSPYLPESTFWFAPDNEKIRGHWCGIKENNTVIFNKQNIGYFDDVVTCHKFFFAVRGKLLKEGLRFDERFKFDLYNIDLCLQVLERGYKIAIIDTLVQHVSEREGNIGLDIFKDKYKEYSFPITLDQFKNDQISGVEISL